MYFYGSDSNPTPSFSLVLSSYLFRSDISAHVGCSTFNWIRTTTVDSVLVFSAVQQLVLYCPHVAT